MVYTGYTKLEEIVYQSMNHKQRLIVGVTAPLSVVLLKGQLKHFNKLGYEVYLMAPETEGTLDFCAKEGAELLPVPIEREISFWSDFKCLFIIIKHIVAKKPDVINVGTPKMGLLGSLAAWIMRVPKRIYTCRGFRYEHEKGLKKWLLVRFEKVVNLCVHRIICISPSVRQKGLEDGVIHPNKAVLIGKGSSNGVDLTEFDPEGQSSANMVLLKEKLGLGNEFVYGFVGRIIDRKGVNELYEAFVEIHRRYPETRLIIVGKANLEQVSNPKLMELLSDHPAITLTGYVYNVSEYMKLFDVFVLPAWWEGFGNALIQAASMGLPIISCNVTGCRDAVKDGFNGRLVPAQDKALLVESMLEFYHNGELRKEMGQNGLTWAKNFSSEFIWNEMNNLYQE